ncbi:putative DNA repair protein RAD50 [Venustampulla echinocandica]|uniref:DNA repair protein RAD50 n=1 Tax=Venustampulla echinocandica TaxID=2656787 RepID=A0A370TEN8_9HELO|nr:putative DNA repair protein RAD50 [Venustampulla echinocandica]RDL33156.1 putative DNA repair protein RAD50 [Venustampulla echinocandica]
MGRRVSPNGRVNLTSTRALFTQKAYITISNREAKDHRTIIECLKYATTGQLPPNSKGGAFVHEPKLVGEKEVMAQVKLQFKDHRGSKLVVTRSLQLTVKKTTRTMKSLDASLLMIKDGERTSLSTRMAEMDGIIPKYLGVSAAILESVIFCHQDESLWPMSEPSVLKKKFDEIFEAMKYTKAIDNLKALRKDHMDKLKSLKHQETTAKDNKDKADRVERKCKALAAETDLVRDKVNALDKDIEVAMTVKQDRHMRAAQAFTVVEELKQKSLQAEYLRENVNELKSHLNELQESDEWLESTLAQYDERMAQYKEEEENLRVQYNVLKEGTKTSTRQMSERQAERGQLQAEKESYERQVQSRVQLVKEAARHHSMRGYDGDLDDSQIREFVGRIEKLARDKDRELERIRKTMDDELQQAQAVITDLERQRTALTQEKINARQTIAGNDKKSNAKQNDMSLITVDEGAIAALEISLKGARERLERLTSEYEAADWDNLLKTERNQLRQLQDESARLRSELIQSNKLVQGQAQLELVKKEAKDRQARLDTLKATYQEQLASIVGPDWRVESLEREFQDALNQRTRAVEDAKKQQDGMAKDLSGVEFQLKSCRGEIKKKKNDMQRCMSAVLASITTADGDPLSSIDDYPNELQAIEKERNQARKDLDGMVYYTDYYKTCLETVNQRNSCRLCQRKFADGREQSAALERINKLLAKQAKDQLEEELRVYDEDYRKADACRSQYETYKTLSSELPTIENNLEKLESEKASLVANLERQDTLVSNAEAKTREVTNLSKTVTTITQYNSEISKYENDIARLSSQQKLSGSLLSTDELDQQSTACEEQIRTANNKINKLIADKEQARSTINSLEREEADFSQKLNSAQYKLEKKQALSSAIEELRENTVQLRDAIQRADDELESLAPRISKARAQREDIQKRGRVNEKEVQAEKDNVAKTVHKFKVVEESISKYEEEDGAGKLAACHRAISNLEQEQKRIETEISHVTKSANEMKARADDSESTRKSIVENMRYRKNLRDLKDIQDEIAELNSRNVTEDYEQLEYEATDAERNYQNLVADRGPMVGEIKSKDQELAGLLQEWEAEYKDAGPQYREAHVKVEITTAAVDDLAKYGHALDAAIMKYHSLKMEEINQIAGELWQRTYQGTDVDRIMIRSENENEKAKRNYNYRVVMVKEDTEMDMRGRCSAGQKVLASIIIRLALAECFGINCGVIALDEPTTNLDRDNIKALADSLHSIIKARRHQSNFQLIIITHDEDFLREMNCSDFCETYWKVSRDDKQKSSIERQSLSNLM